MPGQRIAFGSFSLDPDRGTLSRNGDLVAVGRRGVLLLEALLKFRGEVVTKAELMDVAWPGANVEESNLSVQIASLRKILGPAPRRGEWIVTVPRIGYRFLAQDEETRLSGTVPPGASQPVVPLLAVLPFLNLSGTPEQDYFADGVVEDIITALSRFKSFAAIARNSSFVYKGRAVDVRLVAKKLNVQYLLEGSVRRVGTRLRIGTKLVDGLTGAQLWAEQFDGAPDDVFDFQDRITESVAALIEPRIHRAEIERSRRERPGSVEIYDIYLRALTKISSEAAKDNAEAYSLLTEALTHEPDNALFLAHAAWALEHRIFMGWPAVGPDDREKCADLARRGLEHAAGDAMLMALCGMALLAAREYEWGVTVVQSAVEANPNNLLIVARAGLANLFCGKIEDVLGYLHRANRMSLGDPGAHYSLTGVAMVHMIYGNYEEAAVWAVRALVSNPNFSPALWAAAAASAHLGRMDEAHRLLESLRRITPGVTIASIKARERYRDPSRLAAVLDGLRLAGLDEG
jgi:TolB-like protein/tetratricopeptide (TPR) repeat protein